MIKRFDNLNVLSATRAKQSFGLTPLLDELAMLQIASSTRKSKDDFIIGLAQSTIGRTGRAEQPREQQEVARQLNTLFDEGANGEE